MEKIKKEVVEINKSMDELAYFSMRLENTEYFDEIVNRLDYRLKKLFLACFQEAYGEEWEKKIKMNNDNVIKFKKDERK